MRVAPAGTPDDVIAALSAALAAALAAEGADQMFLNVGATPNPSSPADLGVWIGSEVAKWQGLIAENAITLE